MYNMATLQMEPTAAETALSLTQTRVIRAPRKLVYEAWTNPEIMKEWFGPANMRCPSATLDVREGGAYRIEMRGVLDPATAERPNEATTNHTSAAGHFTKIIPNELLQFTWNPVWNPGEESLVTVSLKDVPNGTEVTLLHERFSTITSRDGHNHGWAGSLAKLATVLEN
jgi:uncharacterized protein YndB with AHSA1/START domain